MAQAYPQVDGEDHAERPRVAGLQALRLLPLAVPLVFLAVGLALASQHTILEEWDGALHIFAARELAQGAGYTGWASHFWPPLFPLLILALSPLMTAFAAGKLISVLAAALLLLVSYYLAVELSGSRKVALASQLLLATNPLFVGASFQCENHMLDSLLYVSTILLLIVSLRKGKMRWFLAAGVCAGLAGLSRYTSMSLIPAGVLAILWLTRPRANHFLTGRRRLAACGTFVLGFLIIQAPWFYLNYRATGSVVGTWQYLNIGLSVMPRVWPITRVQWWWLYQSQIHSIGDIIAASRLEYLANFAATLRAAVVMVLHDNGWLGLPGLAGVLALPWLMARRKALAGRWMAPVIAAICYVALVCQAFVFGEVFLSFSVLLGITALLLLRRLAHLAPAPVQTGAVAFVLLALLAGNVAHSNRNTLQYLHNVADDGALTKTAEITRVLQSDPQIGSRYLMTLHGARAYYAGSRYMCIPLYFQNDDPAALVTYGGLTEAVRRWAPRHPFRPMVDRADYLVFDEAAQHYLPQFAYLLDPATKRVPKTWKAIYAAPGVVVWRVR
ncbi:MAG: ArnT family glycosyltransferase [Armatimonadota bacterium]